MYSDGNFFKWFGEGLSSHFTIKKYNTTKYTKCASKYTGKKITENDIKSASIRQSSLGMLNKDDFKDLDSRWGMIAGGTLGSSASASASADVEYEKIKVSEKLEVNGIDVGATLKTIQERFLILEDDFQKHEQYPALKDAYEKYKLIELLLKDNNNGNS